MRLIENDNEVVSWRKDATVCEDPSMLLLVAFYLHCFCLFVWFHVWHCLLISVYPVLLRSCTISSCLDTCRSGCLAFSTFIVLSVFPTDMICLLLSMLRFFVRAFVLPCLLSSRLSLRVPQSKQQRPQTQATTNGKNTHTHTHTQKKKKTPSQCLRSSR